MPGRAYPCIVLNTRKLTPTVTEVLFKPLKRFIYEPGQFVSVTVPPVNGVVQLFKRMYSLASPVELAKNEGYRLCVKQVPGGAGSQYLAGLQPGDPLEIMASYGDFIFVPAPPSKSACFIATGTGIAPMRAMLLSREFNESRPAKSLLLFGAREESEILYPELGKEAEIDVVHALSKPSPSWTGFLGRVTDYLKSLPKDWPWHETMFYLCGAGQMVEDVYRILTQGYGVSPECIHREVFTAAGQLPPIRDIPKEAA